MYEHKKQPLLSRRQFLFRMWYNLLISMCLLAFSLVVGVIGFHFLNESGWIDSLHNASMLLGGMGPVVEMNNNAAKLFSSGYALFCGIVFITNIGIFLAPVLHRIIHRFHLGDEGK
ncbi:hypothetical protein [Flavihumibacter profundi]|uniref:hypothetical protein n=1 Tax=Flavihumibacter profundi TaxID=2716883 RepID=UPI001CC6AAD7|nr:hypothetical protein [Flavihumibacter profundi]MBZ5857440.1 hypothetical protein [Flavihumibacter profundi]